VMVPRNDVVYIERFKNLRQTRSLFLKSGYSRLPVIGDNLDDVLGFVYLKDVVRRDFDDPDAELTEHVEQVMRPAHFVPDSKPADALLSELQKMRQHIAVVVDEYGGTAGLVTIEDLLEEIVGEIRDEYDVESDSIEDEGGGSYVFSGKVDIDEVGQRLKVQIEREGFETVGGYLLTHLGRVPAVGEQVDIDGLHVEVLGVERRRINKVRVSKVTRPEMTEDAAVRGGAIG
jgi:CBS domain containing-hemolysin-like protein